MVLTGSMIAAGLGAASSIYGGLQASEAMRKIQKNLQDRKTANEAWYDKNYNEDMTQRADAQRVLQTTAEQMRKRNEQARGRVAVTGGTEESLSATKEANTKAMADAASRIAAAGASHKDAVEKEYMRRRDGLDDALNQLEREKAAGITKSMSGVASAAGQAGSGFDDYMDIWKKSKEQETEE